MRKSLPSLPSLPSGIPGGTLHRSVSELIVMRGWPGLVHSDCWMLHRVGGDCLAARSCRSSVLWLESV